MDKLRRVVAMLSVILIVILVIGAFICACMGSRYFWGMLFLSFVVPVVLWAFMWFTRLVSEDSEGSALKETEIAKSHREDKED